MNLEQGEEEGEEGEEEGDEDFYESAEEMNDTCRTVTPYKFGSRITVDEDQVS